MVNRNDGFDAFCIYCQREYASPRNLWRHVLRMHPDTAAADAVRGELR
jgi:hypothetical protein